MSIMKNYTLDIDHETRVNDVEDSAEYFAFSIIILIFMFALCNWSSQLLETKDQNHSALHNFFLLYRLALLFFLVLEISLMGLLTSQSYVKLNILHQIAGYTAFAEVVVHAL